MQRMVALRKESKMVGWKVVEPRTESKRGDLVLMEKVEVVAPVEIKHPDKITYKKKFPKRNNYAFDSED